LVRLATVSIAFGVMKVITNATPSNRFSSWAQRGILENRAYTRQPW
jgi:hypothetical protein